MEGYLLSRRQVFLSVKTHTCRLLSDQVIFEEDMQPGKRYINIRYPRQEGKKEKPYLEEVKREPEYYAFPEKCKCRLWMTLHDAVELNKCGQALWAYGVFDGVISVHWPGKQSVGHIWRPVVREKVPRIDLITKADIQRAYGFKYERLSRQQDEFARYIEEVHAISMQERAKLIVPFKPDPFHGRVLFPFSNDQRTVGGHAEDN